ncbi:unnamed protein product [Durusdinium trenchii]|uniref:Uncharacterized protein n=1 Tax=Durusdinium trenchii TaxID=1381693 RepID=A0ABP0JAI4_9DINO
MSNCVRELAEGEVHHRAPAPRRQARNQPSRRERGCSCTQATQAWSKGRPSLGLCARVSLTSMHAGTALVAAVLANDVASARVAVENVDARLLLEEPLIEWVICNAASRGLEQLFCEVLLPRVVEVMPIRAKGKLILAIAQSENLAMLGSLLKSPPNVGRSFYGGILDEAVRKDQPRPLAFLVPHLDKVRNHSGFFMRAVQKRHFDCATALLKHGWFTKEEELFQTIGIAAPLMVEHPKAGQVVRDLLCRLDVRNHGNLNTWNAFAMLAGDEELVRTLMRLGASARPSLNSRINSQLILGIQNRQWQILGLLCRERDVQRGVNELEMYSGKLGRVLRDVWDDCIAAAMNAARKLPPVPKEVEQSVWAHILALAFGEDLIQAFEKPSEIFLLARTECESLLHAS